MKIDIKLIMVYVSNKIIQNEDKLIRNYQLTIEIHS